MNPSNLAQQILADIWEFGRVILIIAGAFAWGSILKRSEEKSERSRFQIRLVLITLGIIGPFGVAAFFNVEFGNVIALMQAKPLWGAFTGLVGFLVILSLAAAAYEILAANRRASPLSIRETGEPPPQLLTRKTKSVALVLWLLMSASLLWLWRIAQ